MDGSEHDWFEGRGDRAVLMVMIDDATSWMLAGFFRRENLGAAFEMFERWAGVHGLPRALYGDRAGVYRAEREATGWELIHGIEAANAFLDGGYLARLNQQFTCPAGGASNLHRAVESTLKLDQVLCEQERRVVGRDWCVRWNNQHVQIDKRHESLSLPGKAVLVKHKRDGTILVEHAGELLDCRKVITRPAAPRRQKPVIKNNKKWTPPATHPWRQGLPPLAAAGG